MIEQNNYEISRACFYIAQRWKAELAYTRATYRVSYYRKIKARLEKQTPNKEWQSNILELAKKIEAARLIALKRNEEMVKLKEKTKRSLNIALKKANGQLIFKNGKVVGIMVTVDYKNKYTVSDIAERAAQYEATKELNKVLSR